MNFHKQLLTLARTFIPWWNNPFIGVFASLLLAVTTFGQYVTLTPTNTGPNLVTFTITTNGPTYLTVTNVPSGGGDVTGESALYYLDNNGNDSSGNAYNLTLNGSPSFVTSLNGSTANGALSFNGSSQSALAPTATIVNPSTTDFTTTCWIKVVTFAAAAGGVNQRVLSQNIDNNNAWQFTLSDVAGATTPTFAFVVVAGGSDYSVLTAGSFSTATVYFIALTWDHTSHTASIWINGSLQSTISQIGYGVGSNDNVFCVGARNGSSGWFDGTLDDARIYPRILTSTELGTLNTNGAKQ